MSTREERVEAYYHESARVLAERIVGLEDGRDKLLHDAAGLIRDAYAGEIPELSWVTTPFDAADLIDPESDRE